MYQVSGIHINKGELLPLLTIPVPGETIEELAEQVVLGFQILSLLHQENLPKRFTKMLTSIDQTAPIITSILEKMLQSCSR